MLKKYLLSSDHCRKLQRSAVELVRCRAVPTHCLLQQRTSGEMNLAGKSAEKWSKQKIQKQEKKERLFEQVNATLNLFSPQKFGESALYTCLFKRCLQ